MGKRRTDGQAKETKVIRSKHEEEQRPSQKPVDAISRLAANVAQSADVHTLQKTLGNKTVSNMIHRHAVSNVSFEYEDEGGGTAEQAPSGGTQGNIETGHELTHASGSEPAENDLRQESSSTTRAHY